MTSAHGDHERRGRGEPGGADDAGRHGDMKTTKIYIHMAGVVFRDEAERLEARLLGSPVEETASVPLPLLTDEGR